MHYSQSFECDEENSTTTNLSETYFLGEFEQGCLQNEEIVLSKKLYLYYRHKYDKTNRNRQNNRLSDINTFDIYYYWKQAISMTTIIRQSTMNICYDKYNIRNKHTGKQMNKTRIQVYCS